MTQLILFGVMEAQPGFAVETTMSGLDTVGERRQETWKLCRRAQKMLLVQAQIKPHSQLVKSWLELSVIDCGHGRFIIFCYKGRAMRKMNHFYDCMSGPKSLHGTETGMFMGGKNRGHEW